MMGWAMDATSPLMTPIVPRAAWREKADVANCKSGHQSKSRAKVRDRSELTDVGSTLAQGVDVGDETDARPQKDEPPSSTKHKV